MSEKMKSMKNILILEVFSIKENLFGLLFYYVSIIIKTLLTLPPIPPIPSEIDETSIINVDKHSKRPSSRKRQSAKLTTLIFNFINVEDIFIGFPI